MSLVSLPLALGIASIPWDEPCHLTWMCREVNGEAGDHGTAGDFGTGLVDVLMALARPAPDQQQPAGVDHSSAVLQAALQVSFERISRQQMQPPYKLCCPL